MKIKGIFVSRIAVDHAKKLIKEGEAKNPNFVRSEAFKEIDQKYGFPPHTMAQCFGKMESTISKKKLDLQKKFGGKTQKLRKSRYGNKLPTWKASICELNIDK